MFHLNELEGYYDICLQVLKRKSEFRKKKENSVNKTLCKRLKSIQIPRGTYTSTFSKNENFEIIDAISK